MKQCLPKTLALLVLFNLTVIAQNWTWMGGSSHDPYFGNYGVKGVSSPSNLPKCRRYAASWRDVNGNFWVFGVYGVTDVTQQDDLWKYDVSTGLWTWIKGSNTNDQVPVYGTRGVEDQSNTPGARTGSVTWTDAQNNLWLFGGTYSAAAYNDLWKYNISTNCWTWMKGSNTANISGVYGTKGVPNANNTPGAREYAVSWTDVSGNLCLFGGHTGWGYLNDVWKFEISTNNWTWIAGSNTLNQYGVYGVLGVENSSNCPGGRKLAVASKDLNGNLWLFGGKGLGESGGGNLNDLWRYNMASGNWTWMKGAKVQSQGGVYGTMGIEDALNTPGCRNEAVSWSDANGNFWIFGGLVVNQETYINDLWKYNVMSGNWTWMKDSSTGQVRYTFSWDLYGSYGSMGVEDPSNVPGARGGGSGWTDQYGNLWMFGGYGVDATGYSMSSINHILKYNVQSGNWTWMNGPIYHRPHGIYGTMRVESSQNWPGGRKGAVSWTGNGNTLWLFGGNGCAASGYRGDLNDLWKYDLSTGNWTWMKGATAYDQPGIYGTRGVESSGNTPGARYGSVSWTDKDGNLWLFGGYYAVDHTPSHGFYNDLWKFNPTTGNWTWVKGSNTKNQYGSYGTLGLESATNTPGARAWGVSWTDNSGNLWLFGGIGYCTNSTGDMNDLWKFNIESGNWTWMNGSNTTYQYGSYGTLGVDAPTNKPGARGYAASVKDLQGNLWLFGGGGLAESQSGTLNDFWRYNMTTGNWTWMKGSKEVNAAGEYGNKGAESSMNTPGARNIPIMQVDANGNFWLFGGTGYNASSSYGYLNDFWKYNAVTGNWIWIKGEKMIESYGIYGTKGVSDMANMPGARYISVSWSDAGGNLWLFGGKGYYLSGLAFWLNDMWKCSFNQTPIAVCQNIEVDADDNCDADVDPEDVDNGSSDPDGDPITFSLAPIGPYPLGTTQVTLTVSDNHNTSSSCTAVVTVVDETPPIITVTSTPQVLWPPNHDYVTIPVSQLVSSVSDNCSIDGGIDAVKISTVSSDEVEDANGNGDGNTLNDMVIAQDCKSVQLRSEREGTGNGRVYTINFKVEDVNGNIGTASKTVTVPHSQNGDPAYDDGPVYIVGGSCSSPKIITQEWTNASGYLLEQNYPNPFNPSTIITYGIPEDGIVLLCVFDVHGRIVSELVNESKTTGIYTVEFNANNLPSGIYLYRLEANERVLTGTMTLMK